MLLPGTGVSNEFMTGRRRTLSDDSPPEMSQRKPDYVDDADIDESLDDLPAADAIEEAVENLEANGFEVVVVDSADAALAELQSLIPAGASVMNGHSTTLEEIGFTEYLSEGDHEWESLPDEIWSIEDDADDRPLAANRRRQTTSSAASTLSHSPVNSSLPTDRAVASVRIRSLPETSSSSAA